MQTTTKSTDFSDVVGVTVRSRMLEHLSECSEPKQQYKIAEALGVSQASVSRSTHDLLTSGVITKDERGRLSIHPDAEAGVGLFRQAISDGMSSV